MKRDRNLIWIGILSVLVPIAVAFLLFNPNKIELEGQWIYMLPGLNAVVNTATAVLLLFGLYFIKKGNEQFHRYAMVSAFTLGCVFLVSYIIYHSTAGSVKFGDSDGNGLLSAAELASVGSFRTFYLAFLLLHIVFAAIVVPLVLLAVYYGWIDNRNKHRKIVKFTWPIWFFVSISGVIVYLMISPYYQF